MKALGYIRVSTDEQAESGLGLAAQRKKIEDYCRLVDMELVEIIADEGVSGGKPISSRPGGRRLLKAIQAGLADAVVVMKLDRAFRSCRDCLNTIEPWEHRGIGFHIIDLAGSAVATSTVSGKFMLTIFAAVAEMERGFAGERTKAALAVVREKGKAIGKHPPFGYQRRADNPAYLEPNEAEQIAVNRILELASQGVSYADICRTLQAEGHACRGPVWRSKLVRTVIERGKNGRAA
jgi:site-specific DNA recombinase